MTSKLYLTKRGDGYYSNFKNSIKIAYKAVDKLGLNVGRDGGCARDEREGSKTPNPFTWKGF